MTQTIEYRKPRSAASFAALPGVAVLAVLIAVVAIVWLTTPLRNHLTVDELVAAADALERVPFSPLIVIAAYVVGVICLVPVTLLIAATGVIYGAWPGVAYAFAGALVSALATYGVGAGVGERNVRRLAGGRVAALSRRVARQGVMAMMAVRLVPIAPFAVVNVVAGASHIRLRDFALGTLLGMAPGILIKVAFADQFTRAAAAADFGLLRALAVAAVILVALGFVLRRLYVRLFGARLAPDDSADQAD